MFIEISGNAISHNIVVASAAAGELIHMVVVSMTRVQGNLSQPESRLFFCFVHLIWAEHNTEIDQLIVNKSTPSNQASRKKNVAQANVTR